MERRVAELYGKRLGVMCNSGSSAIYLAVELLDLPRGSEVITSPLTFSTDVAPLVRAGLVPVFVDVEPDTYNVDVTKIVFERGMSLGMSHGTTDEELQHVVDSIHAFASQHALP